LLSYYRYYYVQKHSNLTTISHKEENKATIQKVVFTTSTIPKSWHPKVALQRKQPGLDTGEELTEARAV
jgi:hypothetical protein